MELKDFLWDLDFNLGLTISSTYLKKSVELSSGAKSPGDHVAVLQKSIWEEACGARGPLPAETITIKIINGRIGLQAQIGN